MRFSYVVVGAGLGGSTVAERLASQLDKKVLVIEGRNHVAGLCYDFYNDAGVLVHKYGPHIFHTRKKRVWDFLSNFTDWHFYEHRVRVYVDGKYVPFPVNFDTINQLLGTELTIEELPEFLKKVREPIDKIRTSEDAALSSVGRVIYDKIYRNYTTKQWGITPDKLDAGIVSRIPVRINRDDRYFDDPYQGLPKQGYRVMVNKMLRHPNIKLITGVEFRDIISRIKYDTLIYTGPIDYYFNYKYGRLPYRSLEMKFETYEQEYYQSVATVNYPNEFDFTRISEFKHMTGQKSRKTTILKEFPLSASAVDEAYYPIPSKETEALARKYRDAAKKERNTYFIGRLAEYKYYNMDTTVARALYLFKQLEAAFKQDAVRARKERNTE